MNLISYVGKCNSIQIKNTHLKKITTLCTSVLKNSHSSTSGQYFFMKLAPLCSADTELLKHAKKLNSYEKSQMVPSLIAGHLWHFLSALVLYIPMAIQPTTSCVLIK